MNNGALPPVNNLPLPPPIQAQQAIGNAIPQPALVIQIPPNVWNENENQAPPPPQPLPNAHVNQPNHFQQYLNAMQNMGQPEPQQAQMQNMGQPEPQQAQPVPMQLNNNNMQQPAQGEIPMNINNNAAPQPGNQAGAKRRRRSRRRRSRRRRSRRN